MRYFKLRDKIATIIAPTAAADDNNNKLLLLLLIIIATDKEPLGALRRTGCARHGGAPYHHENESTRRRK